MFSVNPHSAVLRQHAGSTAAHHSSSSCAKPLVDHWDAAVPDCRQYPNASTARACCCLNITCYTTGMQLMSAVFKLVNETMGVLPFRLNPLSGMLLNPASNSTSGLQQLLLGGFEFQLASALRAQCCCCIIAAHLPRTQCSGRKHVPSC